MHEYHTFVDFVLNTKLMEYAVAFLFIGLFAIFYKLLQSPAQPAEAKETVVTKAYDLIKGFLVPEGLSYHPGHTWAKIAGDGVAAVGMDDFANKLVGNIDQIKLPAVGDEVHQGEPAWTLVIGGKAVDMISPVTGRVAAVNADLSPQALSADPYEQGWLMKVESPKISTSFKNLLSGLLAKQWTEQSVENLLERAGVTVGAVAGDGGLPIHGMARQLDEQNWDEIAKEFFLTAN
ncbi:MAG: glycine cleavage system protein H [Alphaproteobacteria bacterium]